MTTLRDIANKGYELKVAVDTLDVLKQDKQTAQERVQTANAAIAAQQVIVDRLQVELRVLLP
jgi:hypothetical protein